MASRICVGRRFNKAIRRIHIHGRVLSLLSADHSPSLVNLLGLRRSSFPCRIRCRGLDDDGYTRESPRVLSQRRNAHEPGYHLATRFVCACVSWIKFLFSFAYLYLWQSRADTRSLSLVHGCPIPFEKFWPLRRFEDCDHKRAPRHARTREVIQGYNMAVAAASPMGAVSHRATSLIIHNNAASVDAPGR